MKKPQLNKIIREEIISILTENENSKTLIIRKFGEGWIFKEDNPWIPTKIFHSHGFSKYLSKDLMIPIHLFKSYIFLYDKRGELLPLFTEFGGNESTYRGDRVIKFPMDNPNIKIINSDGDPLGETTMVDKDTDPNDVEGLNPDTVKSAVEFSKKSSKPVTIAEEEDDWYNADNEFDVDEKEPTAKDLKKEPITKIASKLAETQKEMKSIVAKYKVASDAEKPKYVERLKQLTKIKKELEKLL